MAWLDGWQYRRRVVLSATPGAGTGYVIPLRVGESTGSSAYDLLAPPREAFPPQKNDSGDIRFALEDGTLCPFWVGCVVGTAPNRTAFVWVQIPVSLDVDVTLYCYAGNATAQNASSSDGIFEFFDDFDGTEIDLTKWTTPGAVIQGDSTVKLNADHATGTADDQLLSVVQYNPDVDSIEIAAYVSSASSQARLDLGLDELFHRYDDGSTLRGLMIDGVRVLGAGHDFYSPVLIAFQIIAGEGVRLVEDGSLYYDYSYSQPPAATLRSILLRSWYTSDTTIDWIFVRRIEADPTITVDFFYEQPGQSVVNQVTLSDPFGVVTPVWDQMYCAPAKRGNGVIQGTVLVAGEPAHRRVVLFDRHTMRPLAVTWSDPTTGEYRFEGYDPRCNYLVVCGDYTQTYNAAVADWVRPEVDG